MDESAAELIGLLGTRIGMIMEDTSIIALTLGACQPGELADTIDRIISAADQISKLAGALVSLKE